MFIDEPKLKSVLSDIDRYSFEKVRSLSTRQDKLVDDRGFLDVLNSRSSSRDFSKLSISDLGKLFHIVSKTKSSTKSALGGRLERRNYGSAGSLHSLYTLVSEVSENSWYVYDSFRDRLLEIDISSEEVKNFKLTCSCLLDDTEDAWFIWYVCDFDFISNKYANAQSLAYRESGHLSATHSLAAEFLGFSYCPLGLHGHKEAASIVRDRSFMGVGTAFIGSKV